MNADPPDPRERRQLLWLAMAAVCLRWLVAMRTPIPSEDGVTFLWMAQRFAALDPAPALGSVFPPLHPLLLAPLLACGLDATLAGQLLGCIAGGLQVLPIGWLAHQLRPGAAVPAGALAASLGLAVRNAAEIYTEPLFGLLAATAALHGLHGRPWRLGLFAALAALCRSEGAFLVLPFLLALPRGWLRALLPTVLALLAFAAARALAGHGFDPVPKFGFHAARDDLPGRGDLWANLLAVPWGFVEGFGPAALLLPLALLPERPRGARPLWLCLLLGLLAICTFVVRERFFLTWSFAVLPLGAAGLLAVPRLGARGRELLLGLLCAYGIGDAFHAWSRLRGRVEPDRRAERLVGEHLAARLHPGERVDGELPRVVFYAGCRPPPPRHFAVDALVARARQPDVRFFVLSRNSGRGAAAPVAQALEDGFAPYVLTGELGAAAEERGLLVLMRR